MRYVDVVYIIMLVSCIVYTYIYILKIITETDRNPKPVVSVESIIPLIFQLNTSMGRLLW